MERGTFRINYQKITAKELEAYLDKEGFKYHKIAFYIDFYEVEELERLKNTYLYQEGYIYLQNISATLPALFIEGEDILDMCSAPGGKATLIQTLYDNKRILATEVNYKRFKRLEANINKQGSKRITVQNINALDLDEALKFDTVILDAPCSGSGTSKSNDWSEAEIKQFQIRQLKLINKASKLVKKNGYILYSTCSINKAENDDVIAKFLKKHNYKEIKIKEEYLPKLESKYGITIAKTEVTEGFYLVKLQNI